jgi:hypothetical protein
LRSSQLRRRFGETMFPRDREESQQVVDVFPAHLCVPFIIISGARRLIARRPTS